MISILYCGNRKVFQGLLLSLVSITRHVSEPLDVHVVTMDYTEQSDAYQAITPEQTDFLSDWLKSCNPENRVTRHDVRELFLSDLAGSPNACTVYTPYTLLRLLIDKMDDIPDRVIYMDTDTVAMRDIAELFHWDMTGHHFAGVRDYYGKVFISPWYINAGVLLLNVGLMREDGYLEQARQLCNRKKYAFPDQDVLNHTEKNKLFLPARFNEQKRWHPETVIRHFSKTIRWFPFFHTQNIKPWDEDGLHTVMKTTRYDAVLEEFHRVAEQERKVVR